jgi:hypothetical protein
VHVAFFKGRGKQRWRLGKSAAMHVDNCDKLFWSILNNLFDLFFADPKYIFQDCLSPALIFEVLGSNHIPDTSYPD